MKAGSCFILHIKTKVLKEFNKEDFIREIISNSSFLTPADKNKKYKELISKSYKEIIRLIHLQKYTNEIYGIPIGQILYAFILFGKTKEDLEDFLRAGLKQTQVFYIMNADTGSYVRNYNDMLTPPIRSTKDKNEAKLYTDVKEALKDAVEMDELGVGDFVVRDFTTDKAVDGLDYSGTPLKDKNKVYSKKQTIIEYINDDTDRKSVFTDIEIVNPYDNDEATKRLNEIVSNWDEQKCDDFIRIVINGGTEISKEGWVQ